jgi:hypothetical protein
MNEFDKSAIEFVIVCALLCFCVIAVAHYGGAIP